jgi:hypothetical protein
MDERINPWMMRDGGDWGSWPVTPRYGSAGIAFSRGGGTSNPHETHKDDGSGVATHEYANRGGAGASTIEYWMKYHANT